MTATSTAVLVVDDEAEVARLLRELLAERGYGVQIVHTVADAHRALVDGTYALVILDLVLGDGHGLEVLRAGRARPAPPDFIVLTGHATLDSAIAAVEAGAAGYLLKPVDLDRLGDLLALVRERRELTDSHARLQREATERLRETEAVLAIARTLSETLDLREALRRVCRELARLTGADTTAAFVHEPVTDLLQPFAAYHVPPEHLAVLASTTLPVRQEGFFQAVWGGRKPVQSDDIAGDTRFHHPLFRAIPHQSGLVLPLLLDGEVAGAFYLVWWTARRRFDERELELLESIARQVGLLIRNARLFDAAERDRRRLEILYDVSGRLAAVHDTTEILTLIVDEAVALLGVEAAGLRLREGDDLVVGARTESAAPLMARERLRPGESLSGIVVATGAPLVVEDLVADQRWDPTHKESALALGYRALAGVPLRGGGGVIGALLVFSRSGRRFLPDEISLLSAFADHASLAIEKSRLLEATRAREREASKLYAVTSQLASNLGLDRVLDLITADVIDLLHCDAAGLYGWDEARGGLMFRRGVNLHPALTRDLVLQPGEGVAGRAFASRQPAWTGDRLADRPTYQPAMQRLVEEHAPRAFLGIPILRRHEVYGTLMAYWFGPHEPSPDEIRLLSTLAAQAAIAVDNSILFEETRTQQVRLSQIFESTSDGIMLISGGNRIAAANARAAELLGVRGELVGQTLTEVAAGLAGRPRVQIERLETEIAALGADGGEGDLELAVLPQRVLRWMARPTADAGGARVGVTLTLRDVTREHEVNRMKSDFVSFVTHQLRTPLAGIKWLLELAAGEPSLPAEARSYVADSREAAERLITLVNDLLDISRLESGRLTVTPGPVDLAALTADVLVEIEGLIAARKHVISTTGGGTAVADPQLLRQVILNLLSNAAKYTPPGGRIRVRIDREAGRLAWRVTDNGIGIPEAARERLFEKFYRADNVQTLETEGTGLGLYLVRLIVETLKGQIRYESTEGAGTTFVVTLPDAGAPA